MPFSRMSIVTATYWLTAFHFARREAGTTTPWPADTARSPGTATMRVRVSPIGKFTLRSRSPGPWAASLSARGDDLVNVGAVHRHDPRGIQAQARGDVGRAAPRGQMPRPRRVVGQPGDVLAV